MQPLPGLKSGWRSMLPLGFVILGMPIVVLLTNSRFSNTSTGDLARLLVGLASGLALGTAGYLVARALSR